MSAVLRDRDGVLRTVGRGESSLAVEFLGHVTLDDEDRLAVVIDVEELRRQRIATVVALTCPRIEMNSHRPNLGADRCRIQGRKKVFSPADV